LPSQKTGGGSAYFGGYTIPPESTSEPGQMAVPSDGVGPFRFNFSVTPASRLVLKVNQTVMDQGYSVTLQEIRIAPSKAHISYCIRYDAEGEWTPALMDLSNETYSSAGITMQSSDSEYSECVDASAGLFTPELPERLIFRIEAFDRTDLTDEDWQRIEKRVIEKGGRSVYADGYL